MRPVDTPLGILPALPAGIAPNWWLVAALTARLSAAFTGLVLLVAAYTAAIAVPALT